VNESGRYVFFNTNQLKTHLGALLLKTSTSEVGWHTVNEFFDFLYDIVRVLVRYWISIHMGVIDIIYLCTFPVGIEGTVDIFIVDDIVVKRLSCMCTNITLIISHTNVFI
jgi:hypothetical protein